jgi:hypothetical protein
MRGSPPASSATAVLIMSGRTRRPIISRVTVGLDDLSAGERAEIDEAVAVVRRHRTVMLGMPRTPAPGQLPDLPHCGAVTQERPT